MRRHPEIDCIVDVGANSGEYGDALRRLGHGSRIADGPVRALEFDGVMVRGVPGPPA